MTLNSWISYSEISVGLGKLVEIYTNCTTNICPGSAILSLASINPFRLSTSASITAHYYVRNTGQVYGHSPGMEGHLKLFQRPAL